MFQTNQQTGQLSGNTTMQPSGQPSSQPNTTQPEKYTMTRDDYINNFVENVDGIANKLLRSFLNNKFNEIYQINDDTDEIKAMKNYKVTTRLLGGYTNDKGEPDIKRKITNLSSSKDEVDIQRNNAFQYMREKWLKYYFTPNSKNEYPNVIFVKPISEYVKTNVIIGMIKTKLTGIIERGEGKQSSWRPWKFGGKTKKKKSKKNSTRRKR